MKGRVNNDKIVAKRIELDITQRLVAEKTGLDISYIKHLETGRSNGTIETLKKVCEFLGLNMDDIYLPDYRETIVLSIVNGKGGVGKTSVCSSLAYALSEMGKKVLCIDADMSCNLTDSMGVEIENRPNFGQAIVNESDISDFIFPTAYENIDFVIADESMSSLDMVLFTKIEREAIIRNIIKNVKNRGIYDYIIFDTNPVLGMLNYSVLNASTHVLIPIIFEKFSINGLNTLIQYINSVKKTNDQIQIAGILVNKYDKRQKRINTSCEEILKAVYSDLLFKTIIGVDSKIGVAQMDSVPVLAMDKSSRISKQYNDLAKELIRRVKH